MGVGRREFLRQHPGRAAPGDPPPRRFRWRRSGADRSLDVAVPGAAADAQMAERSDARRQEARRNPARAQRGPDRGRLRGQSRHRPPIYPIATRAALAAKSRRRPSHPFSREASRGCSRCGGQREPALSRAWQERAHSSAPAHRPCRQGRDDRAAASRARDDGALRLMLDDGTIEVVRAGDIFLG